MPYGCDKVKFENRTAPFSTCNPSTGWLSSRPAGVSGCFWSSVGTSLLLAPALLFLVAFVRVVMGNLAVKFTERHLG